MFLEIAQDNIQNNGSTSLFISKTIILQTGLIFIFCLQCTKQIYNF